MFMFVVFLCALLFLHPEKIYFSFKTEVVTFICIEIPILLQRSHNRNNMWGVKSVLVRALLLQHITDEWTYDCFYVAMPYTTYYNRHQKNLKNNPDVKRHCNHGSLQCTVSSLLYSMELTYWVEKVTCGLVMDIDRTMTMSHKDRFVIVEWIFYLRQMMKFQSFQNFRLFQNLSHFGVKQLKFWKRMKKFRHFTY